MKNEIWQAVTAWDKYQVSNFGNVICVRNGKPTYKKPIKGSGGYYRVTFWDKPNKRVKTCRAKQGAHKMNEAELKEMLQRLELAASVELPAEQARALVKQALLARELEAVTSNLQDTRYELNCANFQINLLTMRLDEARELIGSIVKEQTYPEYEANVYAARVYWTNLQEEPTND